MLWLAATAAEPVVAASARPEPGLVLVILPEQPDRAMVEALHRLRGEAMSVGFEVRLAEPTQANPPLGDLAQPAPGPAAVVTVARPDPGEGGLGALDVTFLDRATGKTSVARLSAGDASDGEARVDVILAVRVVDFIRARIFDTLADPRPEPPPPPPAPPSVAPASRRYVVVAAGASLLGTPSGFAPAVVPRLAVDYLVASWLRVGVQASGLGSRPERRSGAGVVSLDQVYFGAQATLLGPVWYRCRLLAELGAGQHRITARGEPTPPNVGRTVTLASLAATTVLGLEVALTARVALELRGGAIWRRSEARLDALDEVYTVASPLWLGNASLAARF